MKKTIDFFDKNFEKIFLLFFWFQPILDIFISFDILKIHPSLTLGVIFRGLILLFVSFFSLFIVKTKYQKQLYYITGIILSFILIFFVNVFLTKSMYMIDEIKYIFKTFYFIMMLIYLLNIYISRRRLNFTSRDLILPLNIYVFSILIAVISGTSFFTYSSNNVGFSGWFYAANEVGSILAILGPALLVYCINSNNRFKKIFMLFAYIIAVLTIGTKVPFIALFMSFIFFIIYYFIQYFSNNKRKQSESALKFLIVGMISFLLVSPFSPVGINIIRNYVSKDIAFVNIAKEFFKNDGFFEHSILRPQGQQQLDDPNFLSAVLSSRNKFLMETLNTYSNSDGFQKVFGLGYYEERIDGEFLIKGIEMDFFDIFFRYGLFGSLIFFGILVYLIGYLLKSYFNKFSENFNNSKFNFYLFSIFLGLLISATSGHVLTAPSVSLYLVMLIILCFKELKYKKQKNNLWIDITNSPHSILFNPIIKKLTAKGYNITITARDYAQTIGLLDLFDIDYTLIGDHKGKNKWKKIWGLFQRTSQLYWFARSKDFDASISMSSQTCMMTSKLLGIPHMTLYDYEYTAGHHIDFRLSNQILTPEGVEEEVLRKYGANLNNVIFYPGLKEQFYIHYYMNEYKEKYKDINPIKKKLKIDNNKILIVLRPEATVAHYQSNENDLSVEILKFLSESKKDPIILVLPRISDQKKKYKELNLKNVIIPDEVLNGIELVASADLVIGAGGTVNREAASIGTPVYTIYQGGKFGAVDRMLIETKRMIKITTKKDFKKIKIEKRKTSPEPIGKDFSDWYIELVDKLILKKENI